MTDNARRDVTRAVRAALSLTVATDAVWLQRSVLERERAPPRHRAMKLDVAHGTVSDACDHDAVDETGRVPTCETCGTIIHE